MASHRIEITFIGAAPDDELERAKILGAVEVVEAIENLKNLLAKLGMDASVTAQTIRAMPRKSRAVHGRMPEHRPQAAE